MSDVSVGQSPESYATLTITKPEVPVGGYRWGKLRPSVMFNFSNKPSAWHRFWTRVFLGWTWEDAT